MADASFADTTRFVIYIYYTRVALSISFPWRHRPFECNKGTVYSFPFLMKEGMWVEEKREMSRLSPYYIPE